MTLLRQSGFFQQSLNGGSCTASLIFEISAVLFDESWETHEGAVKMKNGLERMFDLCYDTLMVSAKSEPLMSEKMRKQ